MTPVIRKRESSRAAEDPALLQYHMRDQYMDHDAQSPASIKRGEPDLNHGPVLEPLDRRLNFTESPLCVYCRKVRDYTLTQWAAESHTMTLPHWDNIFLLEDSAANGCRMCAQFIHSASIYELGKLKKTKANVPPTILDSEVIIHRYGNERGLILRISPWFDTDSSGSEPDPSRILVLNADIIPVDESVPMLKDQNFTDMSKSHGLQLVAGWLQNCRTKHEQCRSLHEQYHPTRLVSTTSECIRLVFKHEFASVPEYATLSHCWGNERFLTLMSHNINTFMEKIPEDALSKTFTDAIHVARELGFSYIWIDSLCIIQDDKDDWLREAATMSSVYGSSALNIAASGARGGNDGISFNTRDLSPCLLQVQPPGLNILHYHCVPGQIYIKHVTKMPLMRRGWALQERLLPNRTVHFTTRQAFWECHERVACETFPRIFPPSLAQVSYYLSKKPVSRSMWHWIVELYSTCDLTYSADKMVAIAGLARNIYLQTGDVYVAGLWRKDLEYQLCWERFSCNCVRPIKYRAPTWSWASIDSPVWWPPYAGYPSNESDDDSELWIEVLDVDLRLAGKDDFGQLKSASLRLSCSFLLPANLVYEENKFLYNKFPAEARVGHQGFQVNICWDDLEEHAPETVLLPVCYTAKIGRMLGLLLERTQEKHGQYRRTGFFWVENNENGKSFRAAANDPSCWVPLSQVVDIRTDDAGKTRRIITLV